MKTQHEYHSKYKHKSVTKQKSVITEKPSAASGADPVTSNYDSNKRPQKEAINEDWEPRTI